MTKHSTFFIDESGKASLVDNIDDPFLLTGVILDDEETKTVEGFFDYIKRKYKINNKIPFHSYDIFENPKEKELSDAQLSLLIDDLADFVSLIPIRIFAISTNKKIFREALGVKDDEDFKGSQNRHSMKEFPYRIMASILFKRFAIHLDSHNRIGEIIVDARKGADYQLIKSLDACKEIDGPLEEKFANMVKERCSAICFAQKNFLSGGLEITDLISYTTFFHARRMMTSMSHINLDKIWQQIKLKLRHQTIQQLSRSEIKSFFNVDRDGLHEYLKSNKPT